MIKVCIGKIIHRFWERQNHIISFEGKESFITLELQYSKSLRPYPGGILSDENVIKLKEFINNEFNRLPIGKECIEVSTEQA